MEIILPRLHPGQETVARSLANFRVLACGRRWGKTLLSACLAMRAASEGTRVVWLAPDYNGVNEGWKYLRPLAVQCGLRVTGTHPMTITFPGGGSVEGRSTDDPDRLRGMGPGLAILDECRNMDARVWPEIVRPALMSSQGKAVFISTPFGFDWFHELYQLGLNDVPGWESWRFPSADNPSNSPEWIAESKKQTDERTFLQEYLAEFIPDGSGIFRGVRDAAKRAPEAGKPSLRYVSFFDTAYTHDKNAISVFRMDGRRPVQVYLDRFGDIGFAAQQARLTRIRQYPGILHTDITGTNWYQQPGVGFLNGLVGPNVRAQGVNITAEKKEAWTKALAIALETGAVELIDPKKCSDPEMRSAAEAQITELEHWREHKTQAGNRTLRAPQGEFDDMAIACMASFTACKEGHGVDVGKVWHQLGGMPG